MTVSGSLKTKIVNYATDGTSTTNFPNITPYVQPSLPYYLKSQYFLPSKEPMLLTIGYPCNTPKSNNYESLRQGNRKIEIR